MSISISSDISSVVNRLNTQNASSTKATELSDKLSNLSGASDDELLEACKSFESYLVEQVMNMVKDSVVPEDEDEENEYLAAFGDQLYQQYAEAITDSGQLGIAQKLYEAMKRDYGTSIQE